MHSLVDFVVADDGVHGGPPDADGDDDKDVVDDIDLLSESEMSAVHRFWLDSADTGMEILRQREEAARAVSLGEGGRLSLILHERRLICVDWSLPMRKYGNMAPSSAQDRMRRMVPA